jgi:hypothetical protein
MKFRWALGFLLACGLAPRAIAQADHPQPPGIGGVITTEPSDDSAGTPDSTLQPQDTLKAYEKQMALVTVETYVQLAQIAKAVHAGEISNDEAEYLTRRCYELGIVRLQFLDTLHQITQANLSKDGTPEKPDDQVPQVQISEGTVVVVPPASSPEIPDSVSKYLELTPVQTAIIQARVTEEQKQVQPLLQQLSQNRKALATATQMKPASNRQIRKLAVKQSHILERLIIANSRLQRDLYQILTTAQRERLDGMGQDTGDVTKRLFAQR